MLRTVTLLLMFSLAVAAEAAQTVDSAVFMALQNAQAAQEKGEYAAARKALDAVQARPGSLEETLVWRSRGYLAWAAGNNAEALKWLEQAHASGLLDAAAQQAERLNLARLNLAEERYARVVTLLEPLPGETQGPTLGVRVLVGTGAHVVGPVHVGDKAVIGAHAVVTSDVPAGATVVGNPARVVAEPPALSPLAEAVKAKRRAQLEADRREGRTQRRNQRKGASRSSTRSRNGETR